MKAKKSMFITTILMVAVLIVAVSTATFAWYTATENGSATNAVLTAADSTAANVAIGWTEDATGTSIQLNTKEGIAPMVPATAVSLDMDYAALLFKTSTIDSAGNFGNIAPATPWEVVNTDENKTMDNAFFVVNNNVNNGVSVDLTCELGTDANNDKLVVAVFVNGKLKMVASGAASYKVGDYTYSDGALSESATKLAKSAKASLLDDSTVGLNVTKTTIALEKAGTTGDSAYIQVKAWFDGELLTQASAKKSASFSFEVAPATGV